MADAKVEAFEMEVALNNAPPSAPTTPEPPPAAWAMIADMCNLLAGITLTIAFLLGALMFNTGTLDASYVNLMNAFFAIEGALYAVAGFYTVGIMAKTPPPVGGAKSTMQFAVLMLGGVFFALSSLVFPPCVATVAVVFSKGLCPVVFNKHPFAYNAMAHYGISCFMGGTFVGFKGVLPLYPLMKGNFFSPFWGVTMYFMGAWTIGIFKIWGPTLAGGFAIPETADDVLNSPAFTFTLGWWIATLGAFFLTTGAFILLKLDLDTIRGEEAQ